VRDIVSADVLQAFAAKREQAIAARYQDYAFWKAGKADSAARSRLVDEREAIDVEMNDVMRQLLGADFVTPSSSSEWKWSEMGQQLAFLGPDKRDQVRRVLMENQEVNQQISELASGQNLTENLAQRRRIFENYEKEQQQLASMLSSGELEQVRLATSWTAENLRRAMVNFHPTEEEFRVVFREWQAGDEGLARLHAFGEEDPGKLEEEVFAKIKTKLSPTRYAEYRATWWK
jgi:hypothetical protein